MKIVWLAGFWIALARPIVHGAENSSDWQFSQRLQVSQPGLVELKLSPSTIDQAQPNLQDLRLVDPEGRETPFYLKLPTFSQRSTGAVVEARRYSVSLEQLRTVLLVETGVAQELEGLRLQSPSADFVKSVTIEGSVDSKAWQVLARNRPWFSQGGSSSGELRFSKGVWPYLRATVDDRRSPPIPIGGARLVVAANEPQNLETLVLAASERTETSRESRLRFRLPARNLYLWELEIETTEKFFNRHVAVHTRALVQGEIQEESIASGNLFRIALEGQAPAAGLNLRLGAQFVEPELLLAVDNRSNPPLEIERVTARWVAPVLGFVAAQRGVYSLRFGNAAALAPNYELSGLSAQLGRVRSSVAAGPIERNPNYRRPESLPLLEPLAGAIDVTPWQYRASVRLRDAGIQRITLPAVVLAHGDPSSRDLRLVREGHQIPYLVERTARTQELHPFVEPVANEKEPRLSRWRLKLPFDALPLVRLSCRAKSRTLFERNAVLFDEAKDERGNQVKREVGRAIWRHPGSETPPDLTIDIAGKVASGSLLLEVENGDNLPLALEAFVLQLPVTHLIFKAAPGPENWLYYGNPKALAPSYDLGLVARELLHSRTAEAEIGAEEVLRPASWWKRAAPSATTSYLLWAVLGTVVALLLFVIKRLLPPNADPAG